MNTENTGCRFGITTDLANRESDWRRKHPSLRKWRMVSGPHDSREKAQAEERRLANLYGCVAHPGGANPQNANAKWYVYTFEYDDITPCADSVLFASNAGALLNGLVPPPMPKIGAAALAHFPSSPSATNLANRRVGRRDVSANSLDETANERFLRDIFWTLPVDAKMAYLFNKPPFSSEK